MDDFADAVRVLAQSWDPWQKLLQASRSSPLARSHALASFNYDEVVVMDGLLEYLARDKDDARKCALLSFLQENALYFLADHRRMEKVCSGLNQLLASADSSFYFKSMLLITLTHIFIALDLVRAHPPALEAFMDLLLEQAAPSPSPAPPAARLVREAALESLRELELHHPLLLSAHLSHLQAWWAAPPSPAPAPASAPSARLDVPQPALLLFALAQRNAALALAAPATAPSGLRLPDPAPDLLPFAIPPAAAPGSPLSLALLTPSWPAPLPRAHDLVERDLRRAWAAATASPSSSSSSSSSSSDAAWLLASTQWGALDALQALALLRALLGPERDADRRLAGPALGAYARTASPLLLHHLLLLRRRLPALATPEEAAALAAALAAAMNLQGTAAPGPGGAGSGPAPALLALRVACVHLLSAGTAPAEAPGCWPNALDPPCVREARLDALLRTKPEPQRFLLALRSLDEARAAARSAHPAEPARALFRTLDRFLRRAPAPAAAAAVFSYLAELLVLRPPPAPSSSSPVPQRASAAAPTAGAAPPPGAAQAPPQVFLLLTAALLDSLLLAPSDPARAGQLTPAQDSDSAALQLLRLLATALCALPGALLAPYLPLALRVAQQPAIHPLPLLSAVRGCVEAKLAEAAALGPAAGGAGWWALGDELLGLGRAWLLSHPLPLLLGPLAALLAALAAAWPDLEIRDRARSLHLLATHVPARPCLHHVLAAPHLDDDDETAGLLSALSEPLLLLPEPPATPTASPATPAAARRSTLPSSSSSPALDAAVRLDRLPPEPWAPEAPAAEPAMTGQDTVPAWTLERYLAFVRAEAVARPPVLQLRLALRCAPPADDEPLPLLPSALSSPATPAAAAAESSLRQSPRQAQRGGPPLELYGVVVSFAPAPHCQPLAELRAPYLAALPAPRAPASDSDSEDDEEPRPAVPAEPETHPERFPYCYKLALGLQPTFPVPAALQPRASYSDSSGRCVADAPMRPVQLLFHDLLLPPRLPPHAPPRPAALPPLWKGLWRSLGAAPATAPSSSAATPAQAQAVKYLHAPAAHVHACLARGPLAPLLLPGDGPKRRALALLPPQFHLLLKLAVGAEATVVRARTDCWQALLFLDDWLEAALVRGPPAAAHAGPRTQ